LVKTVADGLERWFVERGCDGFNIMFPFLPEGLEDFVEKIVPELQRRGLFRREYEGPTLPRWLCASSAATRSAAVTTSCAAAEEPPK
jgi:alkanesulfonate monooxygenase